MAKKILTPKKKMYILCEGEKTEPFYIRDYIEDKCSDKAEVILVPDVKKNTPKELVNLAVELKRSNKTAADDVFWVVYDRESVAKYPNKIHAQAWQKATANNINIAITNVCFELWFLLHFEYSTRPYTSCDNLLAESKLKNHLARLDVGTYEKGDNRIYNKICAGIDRARERAKKLNAYVKDSYRDENGLPYLYDCYCNVYQLLDDIDSF